MHENWRGCHSWLAQESRVRFNTLDPRIREDDIHPKNVPGQSKFRLPTFPNDNVLDCITCDRPQR